MMAPETSVAQAEASSCKLLRRVRDWAETRVDIRAALLVGSHARAYQPADEWSDTDVIVITTVPHHYLLSDEWALTIAVPWLVYRQKIGRRFMCRVVFVDSVELDLIPVALAEVNRWLFFMRARQQLRWLVDRLPAVLWEQTAASVDAFVNFTRHGRRFLVDKDGFEARLNAGLAGLCLHEGIATADAGVACSGHARLGVRDVAGGPILREVGRPQGSAESSARIRVLRSW